MDASYFPSFSRQGILRRRRYERLSLCFSGRGTLNPGRETVRQVTVGRSYPLDNYAPPAWRYSPMFESRRNRDDGSLIFVIAVGYFVMLDLVVPIGTTTATFGSTVCINTSSSPLSVPPVSVAGPPLGARPNNRDPRNVIFTPP